MVKACEDALGVRRLELGVDIDLAVGWVNRAVQALLRWAVWEVGVHNERVVGCEAGQSQPAIG